jgi:hypothetical protein
VVPPTVVELKFRSTQLAIWLAVLDPWPWPPPNAGELADLVAPAGRHGDVRAAAGRDLVGRRAEARHRAGRAPGDDFDSAVLAHDASLRPLVPLGLEVGSRIVATTAE